MEHYPREFSDTARAAVEGEFIRALREHDKREREWDSDWPFQKGESVEACILKIFLTYARQAIELGKCGIWTVDRVRSQALEGLRLITIEIGHKRDYHFIESGGGNISPEAQREFEATPEWQQFEDELLALAQSKLKHPAEDPTDGDSSSQIKQPSSGVVGCGSEMDLSDLLARENAQVKAKEAEAETILAAHAVPALQMLDVAKRGYGRILDIRELGMFIDPNAHETYKSGKRDATRFLFDAYAEIVSRLVPDTEAFVALLAPIGQRVATRLGVIDPYEADLCRLKWVNLAWQRAKPSLIRRLWRKLQCLWSRGSLINRRQRVPADETLNPDEANGNTPEEKSAIPAAYGVTAAAPIGKAGEATRSETDTLNGVNEVEETGSDKPFDWAQELFSSEVELPDVGGGGPRGPDFDSQDLGVAGDPWHPPDGGAETSGMRWEDIEVRFLSDERVQIITKDKNDTRNYAEWGFADRRNGRPNQAWLTLRALAERRGVIRNAADANRDWPKVEKRMQEIRRALRQHFGISEDPIPFIEGIGYQTRFKIGCNPSFHT